MKVVLLLCQVFMEHWLYNQLSQYSLSIISDSFFLPLPWKYQWSASNTETVDWSKYKYLLRDWWLHILLFCFYSCLVSPHIKTFAQCWLHMAHCLHIRGTEKNILYIYICLYYHLWFLTQRADIRNAVKEPRFTSLKSEKYIGKRSKFNCYTYILYQSGLGDLGITQCEVQSGSGVFSASVGDIS